MTKVTIDETVYTITVAEENINVTVADTSETIQVHIASGASDTQIISTGDTGNLISSTAGVVTTLKTITAGDNITLSDDGDTITVSSTDTEDDLSNNTTDDLAEGSNNLWYTDTRVNNVLASTSISTFTNDAGYITTYTETDPVFTASPASGITATNITNWDTAYGWGNHAVEGYITGFTETDPIFTASVASSIGSGDITNWNTAYGWGDHSVEGYLTSYTETDPIFTGHVASSITSTEITNWNTTYGWGDHSTEGYLTSYTETDPVFTASPANGITSTNISNWNTAYSWGDHATEGYLTDYTVTESDVTQHQAALSITESQISDLTHYTDSDARTAISLNSTNLNELSYDSNTGVFSYTSPSTVAATGQVVIDVRNASGVDISRGDAVYLAGHSGGKTLVAKADANAAGSHPAIGLANSAMLNNSDGTVLIQGEMDSLDTSAFAVNDVLYVSETAGEITATRPSSEATAVQNIGKVARSDNQNGIIVVTGAGRENDVPNLATGHVFIGNGTGYDKRALTTADVSEGANLYYTDARVQSVIDTNTAGFITTYDPTEADITEHQAALSITESQISDLSHYTNADWDTQLATKDTGDLTEGSNLYYTDARVQTKLGSVSGDIIPDTHLTYDLGSPTKAWHSAYVGPGSLYIDGQKVLGSDVDGNIDITTDDDQNLNISAGGSGTDGAVTIFSAGGITNLNDDTINLGPVASTATINARGTLEAPDLHVGDLEIEPTLINNTGTGANLEIRTNNAYLHANVSDLYVGPISSALKLDENSLEVIGGDTLTLRDNVDITGLVKVNDGFTLGSFNPYAGYGGATMPTSIMGVGQESGWAGLTIRSRGEHDWGLSGYGIPAEAPRSLLNMQGGRLDGSDNDDYLNNGDKFAEMMFSPYSAYRTGTEWLTPGAMIEALATEDHSASGMGTKLVLKTTTNGNVAGSTDASHTDGEITIQGTTVSTNGTLQLDDAVKITGNLELNGNLNNNGSAVSITDELEVIGSIASKNTKIGDATAAGIYDTHGFKVEAGDTAWAGIILEEYVGGSGKPVDSFSNPVISAQVYGGTVGSEAAIGSGKRLITLTGQGSYDNSGSIEFPTAAPFRALAETTETHTSTARGTKFQIETTPNGSTTRNTTLFIGDAVNINAGGGDGVIRGGTNLKLGSPLDTNSYNIFNSGGDVQVNDNLKVNDNLTVDGTVNLNGNVTLGNANTDVITATGKLNVSNGFGNTVLNTATANYLAGVLGIISAGDQAYISDGNGGSACLAFYDGSNWKKAHAPNDNISSS